MKATAKKLLAALLICAIYIPLAACSFLPSDKDDGTETATTYIGIEINPSIEMTLSVEGRVISVYGSNEDAQVLLCGEEEAIVGKDYGEAIDYITALAAELGYLNADNSEIKTTVSSASMNANDLNDKISALISDKARELGISVNVISGISFEISRELDALKERYPDNADIQNLTPQKFELIVKATEGGDLGITAAAKLSEGELIDKIKEAHTTLGSYATEAYLIAKAKATAIFDTASGVILDSVYTEIYAARAAALKFTDVHLGATYQAYKTTERTYRAIADVMRFAEEYTGTALSADAAMQIASALSLDSTAELTDGSGKVTVSSVIKYCDKLMREGRLSSTAYDEINGILCEAEDAAQLVMMAGNAYKAELLAIKTRVESVIATLSTTSSALILANPLVPNEAKEEFRACLDDLNATKNKLSDILANGTTEAEIAALAAAAEQKAAATLERIEADLTEEEKAAVQEKIDACMTQIEHLRATLSSAITAAENTAKGYIERLRNERSNAQNG